jgi:GGDEF domain-containing protein
VADLANAASEQTANYISQTYDIFRLEQLDPAPIPGLPISPTPWQDAGLALVLGLALGGILAVLREQVREPLMVTLQQWQARDPVTSAYKRKFLERQIEQLLYGEGARLMITIVRLEGLVTLDLPTQINHRLLRRIVTIMRDELLGRDLIGHWDDHSFVVVIRRVSNIDQGYRKLEQLQQELSQPVELFPGGEMIDLSPRLGAVISREGDTLSSLKERLSMAIVQAEKNGHEPLLYRHEVERQARQPEGA